MTIPAAARRDVFVERLEAHRKIVAKVANAYSRTPADRDDLAQEIVAALWGSFARFDERLRFGTWAYRVALNVAISFSRSEQRRARRQTVLDPLVIDAVASDDEAGASNAHDDERVAQLNAFIANLGDIDKALMLLYLDRYSYDNIAGMLGLTETNVATKLSRIKQRARAAIGRDTNERQGDDYGD